MKKNLIIIGILVLVIIVLWFGGVIPKQIGKIYGIKYMKNNFPEMQLDYVNIEWNKYYGDYIITFKDKENGSYSCVIGPKYFPISIGQGLNVIMENYQEKYSSNTTTPCPENVTITVVEDTISRNELIIKIADNNEDKYGWGVEFRVQEKVDNEWKDLDYISDDLTWIDIAYKLNADNQLTQKLNIEKYYGKLNNGIYRIVKPVYDNGYVDIYSNEFEIK
ncbi:MAG: hypothetical protein BHV99_04730 [Clostridium sp. 26_21]|nr:MAG: hypothetical protein BHV99_04730 [Clostridium sp. 26_21]